LQEALGRFLRTKAPNSFSIADWRLPIGDFVAFTGLIGRQMADKVLLGGDKKTKSALETPNQQIPRRN